MTYQIIFDARASREFDKLPANVRPRIAEAIGALAAEPRPQGAKKMENADGYRIRVGVYRVVYGVEDDRLVVLVVKVAHRRDVYKDLETIKRRLKGQ